MRKALALLLCLAACGGDDDSGDDDDDDAPLAADGNPTDAASGFDAPAPISSWVRRAGGPGDEDVRGMLMLGGPIVVGSFEDGAVFGKGEANETTLSAIGRDGFVASYGPDGSLAWVLAVGGPADDEVAGVTVRPGIAADSTIWITGNFSDLITIGAETFSAIGSTDVFVAELSADGEVVSAWVDGGPAAEEAIGIADSSAGPIIAGRFYSDATFGRGQPSEVNLVGGGSGDVFVAAYGIFGDLSWTSQVGGEGDTTPLGVSEVHNGITVSGTFVYLAAFALGAPDELVLSAGAGDNDTFVAHWHGGGQLDWARSDGGSSVDLGTQVAAYPGLRYFTGAFYGSSTFGAGEPTETVLTAGGSSDLFVARYDDDGQLVWVTSAGGSEIATDVIGHAVAASSNEACLVAGRIDGEVMFDDRPLAGDGDQFVARYGADGTIVWARLIVSGPFDAIRDVGWFLDAPLIAGRVSSEVVIDLGDRVETLPGGFDDDVIVARMAP